MPSSTPELVSALAEPGLPTVQPQVPRGADGRAAALSVQVWIGIGMLAAMALAVIFVPILSPYTSNGLVALPYQPPSAVHWFGTDSIGRDLFVRVFAGGRVDLVVSVVGVGVPLICGTLIGTAVGFARRPIIDTIFVRIVDALLAFPFVVLILALVVIIGPTTTWGPLPAGIPALFVAIFLAGWVVYARLARIETKSLRSSDYIAAALVLGYSTWRIVIHHIAPRVFRTTATYAIAESVLILIATSSLPFLGAGVQQPAPEWGNILYGGQSVLAFAWWITLFPGGAIVFTGVGISLLADALVARNRADR
jgi:peptide/nickel transport system permease protein